MIKTLLGAAAIGVVLALLAWGVRWLSARAKHTTVRRVGAAVAIALGVVSLPFNALAVYMVGCLVAGQPGDADRSLGNGVRYRRAVFHVPRRAVVHVAEVDLTRRPRIVATGAADGTRSEAMTATRAIEVLKSDLVINANFFYPFHESTPLDYSPHEGELVQVLGPAIGDGKRFGRSEDTWVTFWSAPGGKVGFGDPPPEADAAVTGVDWLIHDGKNVAKGPEEGYPRTAIGLDRERRRLWLVVVDGKQPRYSWGLTLMELADFLVRLGVHDAIQLDGGGSSALVARDARGGPMVLNRPCHTKIPGRQRPVANFLGIRFSQ